MNCVLEGSAVRAFGKALHALSRIGDELWLDPMDRGLALRAVNAAHSAYACFLFSPAFFQQYSLSAAERGGGTITCKLPLKSVLPPFRCLTSIERNVERCLISVSGERVTILFLCRHGISKTHNLCFQESEALQAAFVPHLCPNMLRAPARLLGEMLMHFPVCQEEVTLSMTAQRVSLRNACEGEKMRTMHTEMTLHPDEFDCFQMGLEEDITFCLKEFRGFLSFAETLCLPLSVHFGASGRPVCFSVEDMVLEAIMVLATVMEPESRASAPPTQTLRCADAPPPAVAPAVAGSSEVVPSSQGSPVVHPPLMLQCQPSAGDEASPASIPASLTVCSLLFRALSSEQDQDGPAVLARCSDEEDSTFFTV